MSNRSSSQSQLFLMEFICVVMFFALCGALCINAFVDADGMSKKGLQLNEALLLAQSAAETIKAMDEPGRQNISKAVGALNEQAGGLYTVKVEDEVKGSMLTARVYVYGSKEEICSISIKKYLPGEVDYAE